MLDTAQRIAAVALAVQREVRRQTGVLPSLESCRALARVALVALANIDEHATEVELLRALLSGDERRAAELIAVLGQSGRARLSRAVEALGTLIDARGKR